ncbi:MAG: DUF4402 domain-containing protein [Burkholderiales bacterium]|nr:DUF4402 domain-containing protein [Burkholderiales bacterium]
MTCLHCLGLLLALAGAATQAQTLTNTAALSFGAFTAGAGGTITVNAAGARTKTGSVILVNQGGTAAAAQFTISGTPSAVFTISLPVDGTVFLSDGAAGSMALNGFVSSPASTGVLSGGGTQQISVGATLSVGSAQATGGYTGSFNVTVNYQ